MNWQCVVEPESLFGWQNVKWVWIVCLLPKLGWLLSMQHYNMTWSYDPIRGLALSLAPATCEGCDLSAAHHGCAQMMGKSLDETAASDKEKATKTTDKKISEWYIFSCWGTAPSVMHKMFAGLVVVNSSPAPPVPVKWYQSNTYNQEASCLLNLVFHKQIYFEHTVESSPYIWLFEENSIMIIWLHSLSETLLLAHRSHFNVSIDMCLRFMVVKNLF